MPSKKYDIINVIDLEINCKDEDPITKCPINKDYWPMDIIEFGIIGVKCSDCSTQYSSSILIKSINPVTRKCTELTGLNDDMLKQNGMKFKKALVKINQDFLGARRILAGWGRDDIAIRTQCDQMGIKYPFCDEYINLSSLYCLKYGVPQRSSLKCVVEKLGFTFDGKEHRAIVDAYNTAKILTKVLWDKTFVQ
jgi:inhibitor of KinA sporulation pathway (predicted exonuclease)